MHVVDGLLVLLHPATGQIQPLVHPVGHLEALPLLAQDRYLVLQLELMTLEHRFVPLTDHSLVLAAGHEAVNGVFDPAWDELEVEAPEECDSSELFDAL